MNQIVPEPKISASNYNLLWQPAKSMTRQGWSFLIKKNDISNKGEKAMSWLHIIFYAYPGISIVVA